AIARIIEVKVVGADSVKPIEVDARPIAVEGGWIRRSKGGGANVPAKEPGVFRRLVRPVFGHGTHPWESGDVERRRPAGGVEWHSDRFVYDFRKTALDE